jgi:H+/Cl- antiporter ClcA
MSGPRMSDPTQPTAPAVADAPVPAPAAAAAPTAPPDPAQLLKSKSYIQLLVLAAVVGAPVSGIAYFYLALVSKLQTWLFTSLPSALGFHGTPVWWPIPLVVMAGLLVGACITYLPGTSGHEPAEGFKAGGITLPVDLPGIIVASLTTLALGIVLGPEAPLIAIGGGLGVLAVQLAAKDAPPTAAVVMGAAGSFAAIATLLGSPIIGAFLLMEASGLGGPLLGLVLVPGLLAAGVGTLMFVGLNSLTGLGTFSLAIPGIPSFSHPTVAMLGYAIAFGVLAPFLGGAIRLSSLAAMAVVQRSRLLWTPVAGLVVGLVAVGFAELTHKSAEQVLFSGQSSLPGLVLDASTWTVGALVVLALAKSIAYSASLSGFRGGPVFPAMFIGAALGVAASHLPGLGLVPSVALAGTLSITLAG